MNAERNKGSANGRNILKYKVRRFANIEKGGTARLRRAGAHMLQRCAIETCLRLYRTAELGLYRNGRLGLYRMVDSATAEYLGALRLLAA